MTTTTTTTSDDLAWYRLEWYKHSWHIKYKLTTKPRPDRKATGTTDEGQANQFMFDWLNKRTQQAAGTIADVLQKYIEYKHDLITPESLSTARFNIKALLPHFGHYRPDQVDKKMCQEYHAKRRRMGNGDGVINRHLSTLQAALRLHDPQTTVKVLKRPEPPAKDVHATKDEIKHLLNCMRDTHHLWLFTLAAYSTAARKTAVFELTWDRVDFDRGRINLRTGETPTNKGRAQVPMSDDLRAALIQARQGARTEHVIEWAGHNIDDADKAFRRAAERAGMAWCTPHVLRHSAAVHMAEAGVPLVEIAQYLGHNNVQTTYKRYARYTPEYLSKATRALATGLLDSQPTPVPVRVGVGGSSAKNRRQNGAQNGI